MKKIFAFLLLFACLVAVCAAEESTKEEVLLQKIYRQYISVDKYPFFVLPYLGEKIEPFIYLDVGEDEDEHVYIQERIFEEMSEVASQAGALAQIQSKYGLKSRTEARILVDWASLIVKQGGRPDTILVPRDSQKERELLAMYVIARLEQEKKFNNFRSPSVRKKAFEAVRLMAIHLKRAIDQADKK